MNQHVITFSRIVVLPGGVSIEPFLLMRETEAEEVALLWFCQEGTRKEGVSQRKDSRGRAREQNNAAINAAALRR